MMVNANKMEQEARLIVDTLESNGFPAFFVGGYVRDHLLNHPISDIDIATQAIPSQVMAIFSRTVPTGLQHGTVLVITENNQFEVTTFRTEGNYEDYRRPTKVAFVTNLKEDLARRDFTINAMAIDRNGKLHDPFHGQLDLDAKLIRCVGDAGTRFKEDALRMMRCIRFAGQLQFSIETFTWQGLIQHAHLIKYIAMERVGSELMKMIAGPAPIPSLQLFLKSGLVSNLKEQLYIDIPFWMSALETISNEQIVKLQDEASRWALLFLIFQYDAKSAERLLRFLRASGRLCDEVVTILQFANAIRSQSFTKESFIETTIKYSQTIAVKYLQLHQTNAIAGNLNVQQAHAWLEEMPVYAMSDLKISGKDLIAINIKPGKQLGLILQAMLGQVALQKLPNEKAELIKWAKEWKVKPCE